MYKNIYVLWLTLVVKGSIMKLNIKQTILYFLNLQSQSKRLVHVASEALAERLRVHTGAHLVFRKLDPGLDPDAKLSFSRV